MDAVEAGRLSRAVRPQGEFQGGPFASEGSGGDDLVAAIRPSLKTGYNGRPR